MLSGNEKERDKNYTIKGDCRVKKHNHVTRDIKHKGECPGCDQTMAIGAARRVIANALYEAGVDYEEADDEGDKVIKSLLKVGVTFTWVD